MCGVGTAEREAKFQQMKRDAALDGSAGSFFAFHGSNADNWHGILHLGLKNMSGKCLLMTASREWRVWRIYSARRVPVVLVVPVVPAKSSGVCRVCRACRVYCTCRAWRVYVAYLTCLAPVVHAVACRVCRACCRACRVVGSGYFSPVVPVVSDMSVVPGMSGGVVWRIHGDWCAWRAHILSDVMRPVKVRASRVLLHVGSRSSTRPSHTNPSASVFTIPHKRSVNRSCRSYCYCCIFAVMRFCAKIVSNRSHQGRSMGARAMPYISPGNVFLEIADRTSNQEYIMCPEMSIS